MHYTKCTSYLCVNIYTYYLSNKLYNVQLYTLYNVQYIYCMIDYIKPIINIHAEKIGGDMRW